MTTAIHADNCVKAYVKSQEAKKTGTRHTHC